VRLLEVPPSLRERLPADECQQLATMVGEVFEVCEIDTYGAAWVEACWDEGERQERRHSLALDSHEMEVV